MNVGLLRGMVASGMLGALLAGCVPASVNMADTYVPPAPQSDQKPQVIPPQTCSVFVQDIRDMRLADEHAFGNIGGAPIYGSNMVGWMKTGIATLKDHGYRVDEAPADPVSHADDDVTIQVSVLKAYMESMTTSKIATIVVRVNYDKPGGNTPVTRIYRGVDTSINWADGTGEVESAFERATAQVLNKMQTDLRDYCPAKAG